MVYHATVVLNPGDRIDRYTIEELLGEGGMGVVYRAQDNRLHRRVALKVLPGGGAAGGSSEAVARMVREARAAAALNHPNAVAVYDFGEHEGEHYLAMELVSGTPLRAFVGALVPQSTRLRWLLDVARALAAAHRAGLVHRDIKPENVMLRDDGVIKVLDFGIARRMGVSVEPGGPTAAEHLATVTNPGKLVGTPSYMAPEQLRNDDLDGRADQFAWGVLAYELLTGRLPFGAGRDMVGMIAAVLGEAPPPLEGVPAAVASAVSRALSKDREQRFPSMDEVVALLEPLITGDVEPVPSLPRGAGGRVSTLPSARSRSEAPTISVEQGGAAVTTPPKRRRSLWPIAAAATGVLGLVAALTLYRSSAPPAVLSSAPVAPIAPAPTPITSLPAPLTPNAEALAAYQEGLQACRDSRWTAGYAAFKRAVALDGTFAAALMRLAHSGLYYGESKEEARAHFQRALARRRTLSERDQAYLDALEPHVMREPADNREAARRFEAALRRYPGDAELALMHATMLYWLESERALGAADRCLELDPHYADCWQRRARVLMRLRRTEEALTALERCLEVSPSASDCLADRAHLHLRTGDCVIYEKDARRWKAQEPGARAPYFELAAALHALDRSAEAVRVVLEQGFARSPEEVRELDRLLYASRMDVLEGRLPEAARAAQALVDELAGDPSEARHIEASLLLVEIQQEMGDEKGAARAAQSFLNRREALLRSPIGSVWGDPTPIFLEAMRGGGLLSAEQHRRRKDEWFRAWDGSPTGPLQGALWILGDAWPARTPERAREALRALSGYASLPYAVDVSGLDAAIGKAHLLGGRAADALPYLDRAAASCSALFEPVTHTVATYHAGLAREATGHREGACAAFRAVLRRFPDRGRSVTARAADERAKALKCPP